MDNEDLANVINRYIDYLRNLPPEKYQEFRRQSIEALIRTGVLNQDGTQKESIINWED